MSLSVSSLWAGAEGSVASALVDEIAEKLDMSPNFISGIVFLSCFVFFSICPYPLLTLTSEISCGNDISALM